MTTRQITKATKKSWTQDKWVKYVKDGLTNAAESIVQAGVRMHEFKTESKCCKGGSEFSRLAKEKFGMSASISSRWATIGLNSGKLLTATDKLPNSIEAIYLISTMPEEEIQEGIEKGYINHESTQKDIKEIKRNVPPTEKESKPQQNGNGPNGNEDEEWEELITKYENEDLATAIWDEVISEAEAKKIQEGGFNVKRMAKKLYGDKNDPNMLPSQVASILNLDQNETNNILGIENKPKTEKNKRFFFEVTPDVVALENELENPTDLDSMKTEKARELYNHFKRIVEMWSEIFEDN